MLQWLRRHPWWVVAAALVAVSAILLLWANTRPSFDAYGWLVWGYQTLHGRLDLGGAPSWKPLPFVFTVPYALFGTHQLRLWMLTEVSVALAGAIFAARIAYRLTLAGVGERTSAANVDRRRYGALAAAAFAAAAVLGTEDYMHYILSVQSDPMIVTFALAAVDAYLCGRPRVALACGVLAALGRPEAWPFLALYMIWCWLRVPKMRWMVAAGVGVIAFMWFGIPWITNGRPFVSAQLALNSPRELRQNQITGTLSRFLELQYLPVWLAALAGVLIAAWRRNRVILWLAAITVGWVVVETAFALHGWPALPRYMFEAGALAAVIAAVALGWAINELPDQLPQLVPQLRRRLPAWAGVPVVALAVAALIPGAVHRARTERRDLYHERNRTKQIAGLQTTVDGIGGYRRIDACGVPAISVEFLSTLAWQLRLNVGYVDYMPIHPRRLHRAVVDFRSIANNGWRANFYPGRAHKPASCRRLTAIFVRTRRYPQGVLIRSARRA